MKQLIERHISGKKVLFLFVLANLVYVVMITITIPKVEEFADEMKLLDMMPLGYGIEYVNTLFRELENQGREAYLFNQIPLDLIYPFLFGVSSCLLLAFILKKINKLDSLFYFCLVPLISGFFDYLENFSIIIMLNSYPNISSLMIKTSSMFTILKSLLTTFYFISLIIFLIILGKNKLFHKSKLNTL